MSKLLVFILFVVFMVVAVKVLNLGTESLLVIGIATFIYVVSDALDRLVVNLEKIHEKLEWIHGMLLLLKEDISRLIAETKDREEKQR